MEMDRKDKWLVRFSPFVGKAGMLGLEDRICFHFFGLWWCNSILHCDILDIDGARHFY